ncbi:MAG TPA: sporulation protein YunB [Clostridia bacterium]|nr:sporulation protein YunB [Clostridia bacterium]
MWRRRKIKPKMVLLIIIAVLFLSLFYVERALRHTVIALAEAEAVWHATHAINSAVLEEVSANISYGDLIQPEKDINNQVIFMQINTMLVNRIKSEAEIAIQASLRQLEQKKIGIPLGQVSGAKLLSNLGPMLRVVVVPMGIVHIDVEDSFEAAGINQTRHRIYLNVRSDVRVVFPLLDREVPVKTQIPIADAIIVGPVPQVYLGESLFR